MDVNGIVNTIHANMLKQHVERQSVASYCLLSVESVASIDDDDVNEFSREECAFPTAKQPIPFEDVSIWDTLTLEQRTEIEALIEQYPDVVSRLPGPTDQIQHDIKLLTSKGSRV